MFFKPINRRDFLRQCGGCALMGTGAVSLLQWAAPTPAAASGAYALEKGYIQPHLSPYYTPLKDQLVRCDLCPHACEVGPGERGFCGVRENRDGRYYSLTYGNPCAVHADPIEKKPFFHVLPGTASFSIATAGCNFRCKFCQNWEISQTRPDETHNYQLGPEAVVAMAERYQCRSVASTYVEPTIFMEYMLDIGKLARQKGILKVIHSNGFVSPGPLADLCQYLNAACIDLKSFRDGYYRRMTQGSLSPVLETLKRLKKHGVHLEIVTLLVTGRNDDPEELGDMSQWIADELGPDTPLHFSRFYPTYKLKSLSPTPVPVLEKAREIGLNAGLQYVYIGNLPGHEGEHTICPQCGKVVIQRRGYRVRAIHLKGGKCGFCGHAIPGIWES